MEWIYRFQLFLFDLDGLLVDTEPLHFAAFKELLRTRGIELDWDMAYYCKAALGSATGLRDATYATFPRLRDQEPDWARFYADKKPILHALLKQDRLQLMPGVQKLLEKLARADIKRCVVTNSSKEQVDLIKQALPLLNTIGLWITREHYYSPKPDPQCYLKALEALAEPHDAIIGFEDSLRGLQALRGAGVKAVLICPKEHVHGPLDGALHFDSLEVVHFD